MPSTVEKIREPDLEANPEWMNKEVERWLREDVVRLCKERAANPSRGKPLEQAKADGLRRLAHLMSRKNCD